MAIEDNKQLVREFFTALNTGDVDALLGCYAEDGDVRTMGNTLISGTRNKAEILAMTDHIYEVFPEGLKFEILTMTAEGDRVAVEATSRGDHSSGQVYDNEYHFLFEFRDGKLQHLKEYLDTERVTEVLCGGQRP